MNHIYQLKFDQNLLELIVVSELATNTEAKSQAVTLVPDFNPDFNLTSGSLYDHAFMSVVNYLSLVLFNLPSLSLINTNYRPAMSSHNDSAVASLLDTNSDVNSNLYTNKFKAVNHSAYQFSAKNILALSLLASSFGVATNVLANPTITGPHNQVGTVVSGSVDAVTNGFTTTIHQTTDKAIIDWNKSFDINANEIVEFVQKSKDSAVLNRVLGDQVTNILGALKSNGQVFIVNPHGIVFGQNSHVDVGGLVASTLNINQDDFLNGHYVFNKDKDQAITKVLNSGVIKIKDDGSLALIGGQVVNNGVLEAKNGTVFLLAGNSIEIADLHNPLVSYKVTAKNKAVNLGGILSNGAILLGNQVLNGKPSRYTTSTFADVIGSTQANANQVNITSTGEVVLYGGSVADDMQSSDQTDAQVLGERNSIVENNGIIEVNSFDAPNVKILGDYVHTASNSKITASRDNLGGGNILVGGGFNNTVNKLATLDIASDGSIADVSFLQASNEHNSNLIFRGKYTLIDAKLIANSLNDNGVIETSGNHLSIGKHFKISPSYYLYTNYFGANWVISSDYFALVGSEDDFNKYVKNKTIGKHLIFEDPNLDTSQFKVDIFKSYYPDLEKSNYLTENHFSTHDSSKLSGQTKIKVNKGIVVYNSDSIDGSRDFYLSTGHDNGITEIAIKNSKSFGNANLYITHDYIPTISNQPNKDKSYLYIENSNLSASGIEISQINNVDIINSNFDTSNQMQITYTPNNQFNDNLDDDSSLRIINSTIDFRSDTYDDLDMILKNNSIEVLDSKLNSVNYGNIVFASDKNHGKSITIHNSTLYSERGIDLKTYSNKIEVTNSSLYAFYGFDINIVALPTTTVKNPKVVLKNVLVQNDAYFRSRAVIGDPNVDKLVVSNLSLKVSNLELGGSDVNIEKLNGIVERNFTINANDLDINNVQANSSAYFNKQNVIIRGNATINTNSLNIENSDFIFDDSANITIGSNKSIPNNSLNSFNLHNSTIQTSMNLDINLSKDGNFNAIDSSVKGEAIRLLKIATGNITLAHSNITSGSGIDFKSLSDLNIKENSKLLSGDLGSINLVANNVSLANSKFDSSNGQFNVEAEDTYTITDNKMNIFGLINIIGHNASLVTGNSLQSYSKGVNISTGLGKGTLNVGTNDFNNNKFIKINCDTKNPVAWQNGKDNNYNYMTYSVCHPVVTPLPPKTRVTVVTQEVTNNTPDKPKPLGIVDVNFNQLLAVRDVLDISNNCRPEFVDLVSKRNIAFSDIVYGNKSDLIYKYKLTSEQAEFLFNCYAHNVGYFSNLYNK